MRWEMEKRGEVGEKKEKKEERCREGDLYQVTADFQGRVVVED